MIVRPAAGGGFEASAPAKLNLFLEILGRRPDSYHEIETLMITVDSDWRDALTATHDPSGAITLECDDPTLPTDTENLAVRAAVLLRRESGTHHGAKLKLSKAIPAQAGLAGGSSDASATLLILNQLWELNWPADRLDGLAAQIGSDVAFFRRGPAAVCRGRGERVEPIVLNAPLWFVLVCPPFGMKTAEVYGELRARFDAAPGRMPYDPRPIGPMLEAFASGEPAAIGSCLFNRLQTIAETLAPGLIPIRDALASLGPSTLCGSLMSGSGSAYFGLARDRDAAKDAAHALATLGLGRVRVASCGPRLEIAS